MRTKLLYSTLLSLLITALAFAGSQSFNPADIVKDHVPNTSKYVGECVNQGGDNMGNATVIPGIPYYACGTTAGFTDDYDEECPYSGSTSPDVVYSFAPGADITVDLTLCNDSPECPTNYDTKMYIYDATGALVACNDDACSSMHFDNWVSAIDGVSFGGGGQYYIVIDGYGGAAGNYALNIYEVEPPPPPPACPDNTLYGQGPVGPEDDWHAYTSAIGPDFTYIVGDNFPDITQPICDLHWWGLRLFYDYGWYDCYEDPMPFYINFVMNLDDLDAVCSYDLLVHPIDTGVYYSSYPLFYFSVDLDPCCYMPYGGFVTIQSHGECIFLWMNSWDGDGSGWQWNNGWADVGEDFAFCLTWGDDTEVPVPEQIELNQNYPNPFNPTTTIEFSLTQPEQVELAVFNLAGEQVATLYNGEAKTGIHTVQFDATNLPSGVYFYTMTAGDFVDTRKMVVVK